ncbi:hypothetical protein J7J23_02605 [bacterium]|nr:hypothetical protein [bacterium]
MKYLTFIKKYIIKRGKTINCLLFLFSLLLLLFFSCKAIGIENGHKPIAFAAPSEQQAVKASIKNLEQEEKLLGKNNILDKENKKVFSAWEKFHNKIKNWWQGNVLPKIKSWYEKKKYQVLRDFRNKKEELISQIKEKCHNLWNGLKDLIK